MKLISDIKSVYDLTGDDLPSRPVQSHSGARENIIAGPYHPRPVHSVCLEIKMP